MQIESKNCHYSQRRENPKSSLQTRQTENRPQLDCTASFAGVGIILAAKQPRKGTMNQGGDMHQHVIEVSTEVFHLLQRRAPGYVEWAEEKPGPTQKVVVPDDVYNEFIEQALAHRQTLDEVVREACAKLNGPVADNGHVPIGKIKMVDGAN